MNSETIDYGIDLGTTNSCIAVWGSDGQIEVLKNLDQVHTTPSCIYIKSKDRTLVGNDAKKTLEHAKESVNVSYEFKEQMGRDRKYVFPSSGIVMSPEELSAEVLKDLKKNVQRRFNENLSAAVITIPAAFSKPAINATNKAARLAGFEVSPLCQEPIAAALAYGHKSASDDGLWMVFDFGGGTFDSAIVELKDEEFQIINHAGNDHLGGKDIDWKIIDEVLTPIVQKHLGLPEFSRQSKDEAIIVGMSKLKLATERAKIQLTSEESTLLEVDFGVLGEDHGPLEYELTRDVIDRIAEPFILQAVSLCKDALVEKRLSPEDIEKLILVGGPTQMPIFREILADKVEGLGIPLEYSVDPMTVVAQGAAIFARSQRLEYKGPRSQSEISEILLELNYEPAGPDEDPYVDGQLILPQGEESVGYTIEFSKINWKSGQISISDNCTFNATLSADRGENVYTITLYDNKGSVRKTSPDKMSYLRKAMFREIPLQQTISVARADNSVDIMFEKGMPLPLRKLASYRQTIAVSKSDNSGEVRITLVEGPNKRADRNTIIGDIVIKPSQINRDIPLHAEVELTLEIDESSNLTVVAEIPAIDQVFTEVLDPTKPKCDKERLRRDAQAVISRAESLVEQSSDINNEHADELLIKIDKQQLVNEVQKAMELLDTGSDAEQKLLHHVRNLRIELDKVEDLQKWPKYVREAEKNRDDAENIIDKSTYAETSDRSAFDAISKDHQNAMENEDVDLLRRVSLEFDDLYYEIARRNPAYWAKLFEDLGDYRSDMTDQGLANDLFAQGHRSISTGDVDGLRSAVRQLAKLIPRDVAESIPGISTLQ